MWTVNGVNPNTYGLKVSGVPGWETAPALDYSTSSVPGRHGTILTRPTPQIGPRRMSVEATVVGSSNADMLTKLDQLKGLFSEPLLTVVMDNRNTRQIFCRLEGGFNVDPGEASMVQRKLPVTFTLVADDPWWYDTTDQNVTAQTTAGGTATPQGTAPALPVITATLTAANATVIAELYNSASVLQGSITLTKPGNFAIADVAVIDMANKTVKVNGVNQLGYISAGDFFELDVTRHGDYITSAWPKVRRASANYTMSVVYKRAWR